jgi:hypothetical protein
LPQGFRFCQGDSHPDNAIIADLPWPAPAADQALGGGLRCPPDSSQLRISHAARPVADGERDVAGCGKHAPGNFPESNVMRFWGARACGNKLSLRIRSRLPTSGVPKLTNRPSALAKWITHLEQILPSRQQQPRLGGDDREQITRARQAAEALFRSKPPVSVSGPSVPASAPADQSARKPRVLQIISPAVPVRHEERETPAAPEPQTMRKIPRSQFVRIRTLVKYGMTVAQVAKVSGVDAGEIARILRQA